MSRDSEKEVIEKNKEATPFWKKPSNSFGKDTSKLSFMILNLIQNIILLHFTPSIRF